MKTLAEAAGATLVAVGLVDGTLAACRALRLARVLSTLVHAALEEAGTTCRTKANVRHPISKLCMQFVFYVDSSDACCLNCSSCAKMP